jgi:hypothetical protein
MTVNITPLHDRVLARRLEEKETAKGGVIIPDTAKEKPQEGRLWPSKQLPCSARQFTTLCSGAGIRYDSCSKAKSR